MENYTFYPGQKVVCVNAHSKFGTGLKVGAQYTVIAIRMSCCRIQLDVGIIGPALHYLHCGVCGGIECTPIRWRAASRFRPLDTLTEQVERIEKEGAPLELETA